MALVARPISSNILINDLPPPVANLLEEATIQSLRGVQHRDAQGNIISRFDSTNHALSTLEWKD
jgi:hypothetical protein